MLFLTLLVFPAYFWPILSVDCVNACALCFGFSLLILAWKCISRFSCKITSSSDPLFHSQEPPLALKIVCLHSCDLLLDRSCQFLRFPLHFALIFSSDSDFYCFEVYQSNDKWMETNPFLNPLLLLSTIKVGFELCFWTISSRTDRFRIVNAVSECSEEVASPDFCPFSPIQSFNTQIMQVYTV